MMEWFLSFFDALIDLSNAMAIYILFGLLFAGLLHELVPESIVKEHLGNDTVGSVAKATLFGVPLPVCSCGVIPLATSINKSGASKGATLSFLISTPITGIDSILATFGMFGWAFTLYRLVTSVIIAMVAGILTNIFETKNRVDTAPAMQFSAQPQSEASDSCCSSQSSCCSSQKDDSGFSFVKALQYGFGTLLKDIAKPLFWGLMAGALITVIVPKDMAGFIADNSWLSYLIVVAIAVPMYVCATASLPIAAALILSGVSAGAAFVFLSAGPATNTVTIGVVKKMLGKTALMIYLGTIVVGSIIFGLGLDTMFAWMEIDIKNFIPMHEMASLYDIASSVTMWALLLYFLLQPLWQKESCEMEHEEPKGESCCGH